MGMGKTTKSVFSKRLALLRSEYALKALPEGLLPLDRAGWL